MLMKGVEVTTKPLQLTSAMLSNATVGKDIFYSVSKFKDTFYRLLVRIQMVTFHHGG